jgi:acyl carrier protein
MAVEIVGERGDTLGRGIEGEIVVRSADIAEGYWRDPERTAALFEQNPANPAERAYRTGDLGRWRHDGALEHLGRKDLRVKIRGFRVELEEIESVLTQEPAVVNAAAAAMPGADGDLRLVAYVQLAAGSETSVEMLRARLAARLPAHMIPSAFVFLDELPVGPTGKIARQQLPDPPLERPALDAGFARPRNAREESIAETWREVLGLDQVGVHDGFLALGGDSLKATLVATRLSAKFGRDIPLTTLFDASTIAELAAAIDALPSH